jgi:hypothetical protein
MDSLCAVPTMEATVMPVGPLSASKTYALCLMVPTSYPSSTAAELQFFFARFTSIASSSVSLELVDLLNDVSIKSGVLFPSTSVSTLALLLF